MGDMEVYRYTGLCLSSSFHAPLLGNKPVGTLPNPQHVAQQNSVILTGFDFI